MQKKITIASGVLLLVIAGVYFANKKTPDNLPTSTNCAVKDMIFYYRDGCSWCQKVKDEGSLEKIEALGVKVQKINIATGPVKHSFQGVPTFVVNNQIYSGYRTFADIKSLLGCPINNASASTEQSQLADNQPASGQNQPGGDIAAEFSGDKGAAAALKNGVVKLKAADIGAQAKFFNTAMPGGKTIYYFAVKDKNGVYRAAANACQVCYGARKGFHQEGEEIVCDNCGNRYPLEKIATEKGGCNPGPINPNLQVKNGELTISQAELEQVAELF